MNRLMRDETAEPMSRDQILRRERAHGNIHFPCSADHEQGWRPYPVDPHSAIIYILLCDDHKSIRGTTTGDCGRYNNSKAKYLPFLVFSLSSYVSRNWWIESGLCSFSTCCAPCLTTSKRDWTRLKGGGGAGELQVQS